MRTVFIFVLTSAIALHCLCNDAEAACDAHAAADDDSDRCQLLQRGIDVARHAGDEDNKEDEVESTIQDEDTEGQAALQEEIDQEDAAFEKTDEVASAIQEEDPEGQAAIQEELDREDAGFEKTDEDGFYENVDQENNAAAEDTEGWPDILKKISGAFGGVEKMQKDFKHIKAEAITFADEAKAAVDTLVGTVQTQTLTVNHILQEVEKAYHKINAAAKAFVASLQKAATDFITGVGKIVPPKFKSAMNTTLADISAQGQQFADSFKKGEADLKNLQKQVNVTKVCEAVSQGLSTLKKEVRDLIAKASGLSEKALSKDIKAAKDLLPVAIKDKIDEILKEANEAVEQLEGSMGEIVKELGNGVAKALSGKCGDMKIFESASVRLQVGVLSALVMSVLGLSF